LACQSALTGWFGNRRYALPRPCPILDPEAALVSPTGD
jgi:hypothetical protein